jgi:antitoxin MazE
MRTRVRRWGNSLAVRIPRSFADEIGLERDMPVDLSLDEHRLVLAPAPRSDEFTLEGLLRRVTEDNLHSEVDTGPRVGVEVW